jgi:hypothetical protein
LVSGPLRLPDWDQLVIAVPDVVATMGRYLDRLGCVLRSGSVAAAGQAPRCLAAFLVEQSPTVTSVADIRRRQIEDFKRWLAARPRTATYPCTRTCSA